MQFSDTPTDQEIEMAKKEMETKGVMMEEGLDSSLILDNSRKRSINEVSIPKKEVKAPKVEPGVQVKKDGNGAKVATPKKVKTKNDEDSDEEAEF